MATLYPEDAVLRPPNDLPVQGSEAVRAWFEQALPRLGAMRLEPTDTRVGGDLAVQVGGFQMTPSSAVPDSTGDKRAGKYVLTRAGRPWAIWADLWNLDQPLGPAAGSRLTR
jgi:ketosteroid isomerase-like protein